ncbi:MAG: methionyl-tRNA formyltransferase [Bacteroidia bacterium]|jgi:methionyl-tRNA formyltransferase
MRYVFYGTPEFAAVSLQALLEQGCRPLAVVTSPDRASGRGLRTGYTPVKALALEHGLQVWQPENLRDPDFLNQLKELNADFQLVVAFRKLPLEVWDGFPLGTWNLHASLLPDLRGAAPIHWAIRWGYTTTGLTVFRINDRIDTGAMLCQVSLDIPPSWNAGELHDAMARLGGALLVKAAHQIDGGAASTQTQPEGVILRSAPKISKEDAVLDWNQSSTSLLHFVRAFAPSPGARTFLGDRLWIVLELAKSDFPPLLPEGESDSLVPGTLRVEGFRCWVRGGDGWLEILSIKPQNSKAMPMDAFLRGQPPLNGLVLTGN